MLIINAVHANTARHLAEAGLPGTFGFTYGPLPTWIYQALTAITHDLVTLTVLHAVLIMTATAVALLWLSRSLRLWPWFVIVPLLSPYLWFYARLLWDNPFLIPIGAFAIAGYAAHLTSDSVWGLRIAIAAMIGVALIHLMSVALIVPLSLHMLAVRRGRLWTYRWSVAIVVLAGIIFAFPYWRLLALHGGPVRVSGASDLSLDGLMLPLLDARLLSAHQLDYFFGPGPVAGSPFAIAGAVSGAVYVMAWTGMALAAWQTWRAIQTRQWTPRTHIAAILLGTLACQAIIGGLSGKFEHPQYSNGTWIASVLLAWLAADFIVTRRSGLRWAAIAATALTAVALFVATITVEERLHYTHGTREIYGPTIANQQRVARMLAQFPTDAHVDVSIDLYQRYPHVLTVLRELNPGRDDGAAPRSLEIRYASEDPASGGIQLVAH
jgi:hypothetical protein